MSWQESSVTVSPEMTQSGQKTVAGRMSFDAQVISVKPLDLLEGCETELFKSCPERVASVPSKLLSLD
jgi:hypothetical protein